MRKSRSNIIAIALILVAVVLVGVTVFIAQQIASRNVNPDDTSAEVRNVRSTKVKDMPGRRSARLDVVNGQLVAATASDISIAVGGISVFNGSSWSATAGLTTCTDIIDTDDNRNVVPERVAGRLIGLPGNTTETVLSGWTYGVVAAINNTTGACRPVDNRAIVFGDHFDTSYNAGNYTFPNSGGTALYASTGGRRNTETSFRAINVANRTDGTSTNGQALKRSQVDGNDDYYFGPAAYVGNGKFVVAYNSLNTGKTIVVGPVQDITSSALSGAPPFTMVPGTPDAFVLEIEPSTSGPSTAWVVGRGPSQSGFASHVGFVYGVDPATNAMRTKYEFPEFSGYAGRPSSVLQVGTKLIVAFGLGNDDTQNVRGGIVVCNLTASNVIAGCTRMLDVPNLELVLDLAYYRNQLYAIGVVGNNSAVFQLTLVEDIPTVTVTQPTATATPTATVTVTQPTATATASPTTTVTVPTTSVSPTTTTTVTITPTITTTGQASPTPTDTPTSSPTASASPTDTITATPTDDPGTGTPTATPSELPGTAISIEIWGYIAAITFFVAAGAIFSWDLLHKRRKS